MVDGRTIAQAVAFLDAPGRGAAERCGASDTDAPGAVRAEPFRVEQFGVERHTGRSGEGAARSRREQSALGIDRHACGNAAAGGTAVDLALAKQAEMPAGKG